MAKRIKLGDRIEVVFAPASRGVQTQEAINGRPAYAIDSCPTPLPGDRWEVMVVEMNPARTVYFVEPLNLVESADGLGEVLKPYAPFYHEYIRESEVQLAHVLSVVGSGETDCAPEEIDELVEDILGNILLPDAYKADALSRFQTQRASLAANAN
ncbi:MAG: hypothetical protein JSS83_10810 [Cyanobacteria bacterium SZAS LIN-3]|nr:hypothetical protein [Cyanobacteria bacterium SZAS LIN-3]